LGRVAALAFALGAASPLDLRFVMSTQAAETADAPAPAPSIAGHQRGAVLFASGGPIIKPHPRMSRARELPCDSGEWATSTLFGPRAAIAAAFGFSPSDMDKAAQDTALADEIADVLVTGVPGKIAFASFGPAPMIGLGGTGDIFTPGSGDPGTGDNGGGTGGTSPTDPGGSGGGGGIDPPIAPIQPTNPGTGGGLDGGGDGGDGGVNPPVTPGPGAVPEPASWATMLIGFVVVGAAMRVGRRKVVFR
jgi:hypothetical protein